MRVEFDERTKQWCKEHPDTPTTMRQCKHCGKYYKPSLGHRCEKPGEAYECIAEVESDG